MTDPNTQTAASPAGISTGAFIAAIAVAAIGGAGLALVGHNMLEGAPPETRAPISAEAEAGSAPGDPDQVVDAGFGQERLRAEMRALLDDEPGLVVNALRAYELQEEQRRQEQIAQALPQLLPEVERLVARGERVMIQGAAEGDITLLELADYNCGVCRAVQPEIQAFLAADPNIRHVVKALPYIGSPYPEHAIAAAALQGDEEKVAAFHWAMMSHEGGLDEGRVLALAAEVGLDAARLATDIETRPVTDRVERTFNLARALGIRGTPALIFPDRISAYATSAELTAIAAEIRASR
ncbi:MAG: DsbA family protein [Pseudomonadota bacterium]